MDTEICTSSRRHIKKHSRSKAVHSKASLFSLPSEHKIIKLVLLKSNLSESQPMTVLLCNFIAKNVCKLNESLSRTSVVPREQSI